MDQWREGDQLKQRSVWVPWDWLSQEHYSSIFQHTYQTVDNTKNCSFIIPLLKMKKDAV